jgi:hypothetical protein
MKLTFAQNRETSTSGGYATPAAPGGGERQHRSTQQRDADRERRRAQREADRRASALAAASNNAGGSQQNINANQLPVHPPSPALVRHGSKQRDAYGSQPSSAGLPPEATRRRSNQHPYASGGGAAGTLDASSYAPDGPFARSNVVPATERSLVGVAGTQTPGTATHFDAHHGPVGRDRDNGNEYDRRDEHRGFGARMMDVFMCRCG